MKTGKLFQVLLALLIGGGLAATARAENRAGALTFSPMIGGYVFEGDQQREDKLGYGLGLGYNFTEAFGTELVLSAVDTDNEVTGRDVDVYSYRLDGLYHFRSDQALAPYLAAGVGGLFTNPDPGDTDTDFMVDYGVGLKYFLAKSVALRGDVRHILAFGDPEHILSFSLGLTFQPGGAQTLPPDSDGDGVSDPKDLCPDTPAGAPVDHNGCPRDSDGDGVYDYLDQCPNTPQGIQVDGKGCPRYSDTDSDGDGAPDYRDKCPGTPAGVAVNKRGCPPDGDGDGVPDYLDKCPDTARGIKVGEQGCPLDSDGDGVEDRSDRCPETPPGVLVDERGCARSLTLHLEFSVDTTEIRPQYHGDLQRAAEFIRTLPAPKVLISGHTDSTGPAAYNRKLSEKRAAAVRQHLIDHFGLDPSRLEARGLGEAQPIADNATPEGRAANRRVEITAGQ